MVLQDCRSHRGLHDLGKFPLSCCLAELPVWLRLLNRRMENTEDVVYHSRHVELALTCVNLIVSPLQGKPEYPAAPTRSDKRAFPLL